MKNSFKHLEGHIQFT